MIDTSDHIEVEEFDREYGLEDLLPVSLARELLAEIDGHCTACLILSDGTIYYDGGSGQPDYASYLKHRQKTTPMDPEVFSEGRRRGIIVDLVHELETIGFLILEISQASPDADERLLTLGRFVVRLINRMINLNYRNRMTSGLHGQVVADTYENLKEKAAALALSEEKYRNLAENLEIEVERKTREIKATQLRMLQQEKMASIGQLAAGMAHEINNPVGFVISNLNTLKTNAADMATLIGNYRRLTALLDGKRAGDRTARKIMAQMVAIDRLTNDLDLDFVITDTDDLIDESLDGAKRIKIIVQNLRDFTHPSIETAEGTAINDCLDTTLAMLSSYTLPDVSVNRHYGEIPLVTCHVREINQVFFNILKNAFQAVGDRGKIDIHTASDGDAVKVSIADTGPGIEKRHLGKIFDPFFTTREVGDGTGLGLFQAYSTVNTHGGTITVDSTRGRGSTFVVRLPISRGRQVNETKPTPTPETLIR